MARVFNTAHANNPKKHYTLPPLARLPPNLTDLVDDGFYFVLHAPRQCGKTTSVSAFAEKLRAEGRYAVVFCSVEDARTCRTEADVIDSVVGDLRIAARKQLPPAEHPPRESPEDIAGHRQRLYQYLSNWALACPRPLVLFLDEFDCLEGDGMVSVLSQLRKGYAERPKGFPHSLCIFGMRDVRDYKVASGGSDRLGTSSPFNIKRKSVQVANFARAEIASLYHLHTTETGQAFTDAAVDRVVELTGGQPHLVNALANDVVAEQRWTGVIDVAQIDAAKERIILQWGTHFDSLMARLREDRVRRVLSPILAGSDIGQADWEDDRYCRDLGLIAGPSGTIANAIYREVIPRCLASKHQRALLVVHGRWTRDDGGLDIDGLRDAFLGFWREHAEGFCKAEDYHEVAAQLVVMGFLQRIVNGGGHVEREYAAGTGRMDILVKWPVADEPGKVDPYGQRFTRHLFELKVWYDDRADPTPQALAQVGAYLQRMPCESASVLIFDRREAALARKWRERMVVRADRPVVEGVGVWVCGL